MAQKRKETDSVKEMRSLLGKREMWIGLVTVFVILIGVGFMRTNQRTETAQTKDITTSAAVTPAATPSAKPAPVAKVSRLANTSGLYTTIAGKGDNFWRISVRMCGTGVYYESIQAFNGYRNHSLQPGDVITVNCSY